MKWFSDWKKEIKKNGKSFADVEETQLINQSKSIEDKNIHQKIIRQVCKDILLPIGVFQQGNSRVYLDDNDYFFTMIEFQPSGFSKGTHLNIGINFLWNDDDSLAFDMYKSFGAREKKFVEFINEEQFRQKVTEYALYAKDEVYFYRKLRDINFAKEWILNHSRTVNFFDCAMICAYNNQIDEARMYYRNYMNHCSERFLHQINEGIIIPHTPDELTREFVVTNIRMQRQYLHSKKAMKKMPNSLLFD